MFDQTTDKFHVLTHYLFEKKKLLPDFVKLATVDLTDAALPDSAFADPARRLFPIHTPEHALLSAAYFFKQAGHTATDGAAILGNLARAAYIHEVDELLTKLARDMICEDTCDPKDVVSNYHLLVKEASTGSVYGKYYATTKTEIETAARHFMQHQHKYPVDTRVEICSNLWKTASHHGVELPPLMRSYAKKNLCFSEKASEEIAKRAYYVLDNLEMATLYQKLAQMVPGSMSDPEVLEKTANALSLADKINGLDKLYGKHFHDPYVTIYNMTEKAAQAVLEILDIDGNQFTLDEIVGVGPGVLDAALGPEFVDAVSIDGRLDKSRLKEIIPTLPKDEKVILVKFLNASLREDDTDADLLRSVSPA